MKLNLGCGTNKLEGFVKVDGEPASERPPGSLGDGRVGRVRGRSVWLDVSCSPRVAGAAIRDPSLVR